ncbi:MAG TPA: N-acetylmuramic acid 6-phosphate etherase [Chitinophagaceae bacterium]|nr:N-acetylmuramic acid 6-phosphate etherase [Chitinophagaceae bacterium]
MTDFRKITETASPYHHLERMGTQEILRHINAEDQTVALCVEKWIPRIAELATAAADKMLAGGRLFYIGAGTSGRLGIVDASECPPTFGVPQGLVVGLMAGGDQAIRQAVEFAEDDPGQGWKDLQSFQVCYRDFVLGIAASGTTPYVLGALAMCRKNGILTGCITCNPGSPLAMASDYPVEVEVGPEFVTGSTRMKCGTAQKLVLNMISTAVMIRLGRVEDNKMVHMQLSNEKLMDRGVKMVMEGLQLTDYQKAKDLLLKYGSVKKAVQEGA